MLTLSNIPTRHINLGLRGGFFFPAGRLSAALCRLCHGKFSPRSLRHAFKWPQDSISIVDGDSDTMGRSPLLFHTDFQRLVGVQLDRDPRLSEFICKKCHAKFYKCHSILIRFLQRVNLPPVGEENLKHQWVHTEKIANCFDPRCFNVTFFSSFSGKMPSIQNPQ